MKKILMKMMKGIKKLKSKALIYYEKHKEKRKKQMREYYYKNKKEYVERGKKWRKNNREHYNRICRERQRTEKYKQMWKKYYSMNKQKYLDRTNKYFKTEHGKVLSKIQNNKRRGYGFNILCENILDEDFEWHHIDNNDVVAIPCDLHYLYPLCPVEVHRENLKPIICQIYGMEYEDAGL